MRMGVGDQLSTPTPTDYTLNGPYIRWPNTHPRLEKIMAVHKTQTTQMWRKQKYTQCSENAPQINGSLGQRCRGGQQYSATLWTWKEDHITPAQGRSILNCHWSVVNSLSSRNDFETWCCKTSVELASTSTSSCWWLVCCKDSLQSWEQKMLPFRHHAFDPLFAVLSGAKEESQPTSEFCAG